MWEFERKLKFKRQYKKFNDKDTVKKALLELAHSEKPETLGEYKIHLKVYGYRLDNNNRMLYNVRYSDRTIELIRLGNHKEVYGKK